LRLFATENPRAYAGGPDAKIVRPPRRPSPAFPTRTIPVPAYNTSEFKKGLRHLIHVKPLPAV
jgi:hypothetical protein